MCRETLWITGGDTLPAHDSLRSATNARVFGPYDSFMGYGIVGGRLVSWEQLGREAAALALRILKGESPGSIPFGGEQAHIDLHDWRELRSWTIPGTMCPPPPPICARI